MLNLNLLPWRETARLQNQRKFKWHALCSLLAGISLLFTWRGLLGYEISQLKIQQKITQQTLIQLEPQLAALMRLKKYQAILTAILKIDQKISAQHGAFSQLLSDLSHLVPIVTLIKLQKNHDEITLQGKSKTAFFVTQFVQDLTKLTYISPPPLLTNTIENGSNNFTLTFRLGE